MLAPSQTTDMVSVRSAIVTLHLLFGALSAGGVVFVVWRVLPLVAAGEIDVDPARRIAAGTRWLTRGGAVATLLTGAHLTVTGYSVADLTGSVRGYAVVGMIALWLVMAGLVEAGMGRYVDALEEGKLRTAGRSASTPRRLAGVAAVLVLLLGGWLSATA